MSADRTRLQSEAAARRAQRVVPEPWILEALEAASREYRLFVERATCICDTPGAVGLGDDGPDEACEVHGESRAKLVEQRDQLRDQLHNSLLNLGVDAEGRTGTYDHPGEPLPAAQLGNWNACTRAEAIRQADATHASLQEAHRTIEALQSQVRSRDATITGLRGVIAAARDALAVAGD